MDITKSRRQIFSENITACLQRYLALNIVFMILLLLARTYEYFFLSNAITLPADCLKTEMTGAFFDFLMLLNYSGAFLVVFIIFYFISKKFATVAYSFLIVLFIITELAVIKYMASTSLILGADLFGYSFDELINIVSAGGGFALKSIFPLLGGIALIVLLIFVFLRIKFHRYIAFGVALLAVISLFFANEAKPKARDFKSEMDFNLVSNKAGYLLNATYNLYIVKTPHTESSLSSYFYTGNFFSGSGFRYVNKDYPFLRYDETPDMLGKYFTISETKPNLVFIIVESLGRAYSGGGAYLKSFTPFIDSLENHSLYWENIVSTAGRTFEVLPSVFGSLPYGKSGFAEMGYNMPDHNTIISLLKERGYYTRFFYGGDPKFDRMSLFLSKQNIDVLISEKDFENSYKKMPTNAGGFTWGYGDKDLFKKGFKVLEKASPSPRLDIYLTLSMHDPYLVNEQELYNRKVEAKLKEYGFTEDQKTEYRKYIENYASIIYFDDAIRYFFSEYKKRDDFANTIFFITGDHRMSSPPINSQIDRYHVPLIVYSPMLKETAKFSSVSSHLDFTPSVVAFLKKNYGMTFPSVVSWMGKGLDSSRTFRNTQSLPFIRTKFETVDYLDNDYFISKSQLFKISANLNISNYPDDKKAATLQNKLSKFKADNAMACENNKLIPDSLKVVRKN